MARVFKNSFSSYISNAPGGVGISAALHILLHPLLEDKFKAI